MASNDEVERLIKQLDREISRLILGTAVRAAIVAVLIYGIYKGTIG